MSPLCITTPAICIRQFQDEDLPEVAAIFEYGMMLYAKNDPASKHRWAEHVRKSLKSDLADVEGTYMKPGGNFWVVTFEDDGETKVVGMIALEPKGNNHGEVRRVSVHSGYQRMGIGRKLMTHLVHWATTHSFKTLALSTTFSEKTSAVTFNGSFGFIPGESFIFWENPIQEGFWMTKTLP